jgi:hypothetical protein
MIRQSLALLAIVAFVACSKETPATSDTAAIPPPASVTETATAATEPDAGPVGTGACALITLNEASGVMGHAMKFKEGTNPLECVLISASDDPTKSISFQVMPGTDTYQAMQAGQQQEPLPGVGDKAVIGATTNLVIAVSNGRTYMGGVFDSAAPATAKEKSIEIAKKAVARM